MKTIRRIILAAATGLALWIAAGFITVLSGLPPVPFWTTSLLWSLVVSLLGGPLLMILYHITKVAEGRRRASAEPFVEADAEEGALDLDEVDPRFDLRVHS